MGYYFIVHTLVGLVIGSAIRSKRLETFHAPLWVNQGYGDFSYTLSGAAVILAVATTLVNFGFTWAILTFAELGVGAFISGFLSIRLVILLFLAAPVIYVTLFGSLWGWWYIG